MIGIHGCEYGNTRWRQDFSKQKFGAIIKKLTTRQKKEMHAPKKQFST